MLNKLKRKKENKNNNEKIRQVLRTKKIRMGRFIRINNK